MNLSFLFLATIAIVSVTLAQQEAPRKIVLKVNLGGGPVGDFLGEDQVLETDGFHKMTTKDAIDNTDQQEIFQSQRFARDGDFVMRVPVPDGIYTLSLLFAETYKKACIPGGRVFDISVGTPISGLTKIAEDFDVFQVAGCQSAHVKRFDKVPSKGGIVVCLKKKNQHPALSGFVVEGFPVPKGDGSEYRAVGQAQPEGGPDSGSESSATDATAPITSLAGPVGGHLGVAPPGGVMEVPSAESYSEPAPPAGASLAGAPVGGIPGEAVGENEEIVTSMSAGPGPMIAGPAIAEGQQTSHMGSQHQVYDQGVDIGQSQNSVGPESIGLKSGPMPQVLSNPGAIQQVAISGPIGGQPSYSTRRV